MKLRYIIQSITLMSVINFAQPYNDPMKFFPANAGNMWEYSYYDMPYADTLQTITLKDSIDLEGKIYIWNESYFINPISPPVLTGSNYYEIDTSYNVKGYHEDTTAVLFKLAANQGDQWVIRRYIAGGFEMVRVDSVYETNLFSSNTLVKIYRYYYAPDSTDITGLDRNARLLAYGFGLATVYGLEGLGELYIKGAVINGTLYGDTTTITDVEEEDLDLTVSKYYLSQNYPNPFNPSTIINYEVKEVGLVKIKVYNILGSEVAQLVNETKEAGYHSVEFNASNLPSGIYIYTLQVNGYTDSKKMLFLK